MAKRERLAQGSGEGYWQGIGTFGMPSDRELAAHPEPPAGEREGRVRGEAAGPASAWASPVEAPVAAQPPSYVRTRDHVAAGLLAIVFGSLGVHKFYLGYHTAGFAMLAVSVFGSLISFGVAGFIMAAIGVAEGLIYLVQSQSRFDETYVFSRREWL